MNKGDKLLCKKSLKINLGYGYTYFFEVDKYYEIINVYFFQDIYYIDINFQGNDVYCFHMITNNKILNDNYTYIYEYFYSKDEIRKIKLDTIKKFI